MTSAAHVIKSVGPKLVPFFKTLAIYFVVFIPQDQPSLLAMLLKCLPIIGLVVFIILHTKSAGTEYQFSKLIIAGMLFGAVGDACLIWQAYFDLGLASFLIGHLIYIHALGWEPLKLPIGIAAYSVGIMGTLFFLPDVEGILLLGVPLYNTVLMTMTWRAAARMFSDDLWTWSKVCTCVGGVSFAVSDLFVGIDRFKGSFNHDQLLIMTTYYAGQFGLALSVLDAKLESSIKRDGQAEEKTVTHKKQAPSISSN